MFNNAPFILRRRVALAAADYSQFDGAQRHHLEGLRDAILASLRMKDELYATHGENILIERNGRFDIDLGDKDPVAIFYTEETRQRQQEQVRKAIALYNEIAPQVNRIVFVPPAPKMPETTFRQLQDLVRGLCEGYKSSAISGIRDISDYMEALKEEERTVSKNRSKLHPDRTERRRIDALFFSVAKLVQRAQPVIDLVMNECRLVWPDASDNPAQVIGSPMVSRSRRRTMHASATPNSGGRAPNSGQRIFVKPATVFGLTERLEDVVDLKSALIVLDKLKTVIESEDFLSSYGKQLGDLLSHLNTLLGSQLPGYEILNEGLEAKSGLNQSVLSKYESFVFRNWNQLQSAIDFCPLLENIQDRQTLLMQFHKLSKMEAAGAIPTPKWDAPDNCLADQYERLYNRMLTLPEVAINK